MKPARPVYSQAALQIADEPVTIAGIILTGGADAASITLYNEADDSETAGAKKEVIKAAINTTVVVDLAQYFSVGCYMAITGTTPDITILVR